MSFWHVDYNGEGFDFAQDETAARTKYDSCKSEIDTADKGSASIHLCRHDEKKPCGKAESYSKGEAEQI